MLRKFPKVSSWRSFKLYSNKLKISEEAKPDEVLDFFKKEKFAKTIKELETNFDQEKIKLSQEVKQAKREHIAMRLRQIETLIAKLPEEEKPKYNNDCKNFETIKRKSIYFIQIIVVDENGKFHQSADFTTSLKQAQKLGLELVLLRSDESSVPLMKIVDLVQMLIPKVEKIEKQAAYEEKMKNLKEKEYQIRSKIGENDLLIKIKLVIKSLMKNYRTSIIVQGVDAMENLQIMQRIKDAILKELNAVDIEIVVEKDMISQGQKVMLVMHQKFSI